MERSDYILCKNPINLVSVSEQDNNNTLATGYALAEMRKDFLRMLAKQVSQWSGQTNLF